MKGKYKIVTAMLIFGSIGIFVKGIHLSSSEIAFLRGVIGSVFLIIASLIAKQKLSIKAIKENMVLLILSGAAIGFNWILLFEAYRFTTISNATLSYYFAPVFVMILAPFVLREKLTPVKSICIITAMAGLFLVVNIGGGNAGTAYNHPLGILYGLLAAALYASVILMNKFIKRLTGFETTLVQLLVSAVVLLPYLVIRSQFHFSGLDTKSLILIFIVGIVHTGFAYFLYFGSVKELSGQTIAVLSYIDPISAVIMATIFLGEKMTLLQILGGVLILGSTFFSEKFDMRIHSKNKILDEQQN
jgi:drug/metabolite transporter (DMT)-like permease